MPLGQALFAFIIGVEHLRAITLLFNRPHERIDILLAASRDQRTEARCASRFTVALIPSMRLWMASVTCRAQFPQVMPDTDNSVARWLVAVDIARSRTLGVKSWPVKTGLFRTEKNRADFRLPCSPCLNQNLRTQLTDSRHDRIRSRLSRLSL